MSEIRVGEWAFRRDAGGNVVAMARKPAGAGVVIAARAVFTATEWARIEQHLAGPVVMAENTTPTTAGQ